MAAQSQLVVPGVGVVDTSALQGGGDGGGTRAGAGNSGARATTLTTPVLTPVLRSSSALSSFPGQGTGGRNGAPQEPKIPPELPPPGLFQKFVAETVGKPLPVFGQSFFANMAAASALQDNLPPSADYAVGPGDELLIRAWGQVDVDLRVIVDRNGTINIPKVGVFSVAGIPVQDLQAYLKSSFDRVYRNFDLSVSLGQIRGVTVYVVGQAQRPGALNTTAMATVMSALAAAGGPAASGSMRRIQVKRGDKVVAELDLYDLLLKGDKSRDIRLASGDVINVLPVGPQVAVKGAVNQEAIFELKHAEEPLQHVLEMAGGLSTVAEGRRVTVDRIDQKRARSVEQVVLDGAGLHRSVKDGDIINVFPVTPRFDNAVTLTGFVAYPVRQGWFEGMRVRDLIPEKEALVSPAYWQRRNISSIALSDVGRGGKTQNPPDNSDVVNMLSAVAGGVQVPEAGGKQPLPTDPVSQLAATRKMADSQSVSPEELNWDYAAIERLQPDLTTQIIPVNLGRAILDNDPQHNIALRPGDILTIYSKGDIKVARSRRQVLVRLEGEFVQSGVYSAQPGETLRQLVARVGGLTPQAYLFGAEFERKSVADERNKRYQKFLIEAEKDLERAATERAAAALNPQDATLATAETTRQRAAIEKMKSIKVSGRMVLEIPPALDANTADLPDLPLEDGDRLYVPPRLASVNVFGSVYGEGSFLFKPGKTLGDYLSQAGGATRTADSGAVFVLRADGSVSGRNGGWLLPGLGSVSIMPGDSIVVPEDYDRVSFTKAFRDWTQIFYQFGMGVAALKVLKDL